VKLRLIRVCGEMVVPGYPGIYDPDPLVCIICFV
jgi:hypothetical protein